MLLSDLVISSGCCIFFQDNGASLQYNSDIYLIIIALAARFEIGPYFGNLLHTERTVTFDFTAHDHFYANYQVVD